MFDICIECQSWEADSTKIFEKGWEAAELTLAL
jgi:hypothetical protein